MNARPPDVVIIVMDCVRADEFQSALRDEDRMPFLRALEPHVNNFEDAYTTAPWTLPAHASLFTGLYPWEHGAHNRGEVRLPPNVPRLSSSLGAAGYASGSFSANGFISPPFGLTDGFDVAEWGEWWELYWRFIERPAGTSATHVAGSGPLWTRPGWREYVHVLNRTPRVLDGINRFARRLRPNGSRPSGINVAPWIESSVHHWLERVPRARPVFCFVNLLEAHEPYLTETSQRTGLMEWWRATRGRMDRSSAIMGDWTPSPRELDHLRRMYRRGIYAIDARVGSIVREFQDAGRWDNTLFVLTSDHGQAFGENGMLFHGLRVDDVLLRIPLWIRLPHDAPANATRRSRVSLVDIAPTVYAVTGASGPPGMSGISLFGSEASSGSRRIFAAADGIHSEESRLAHWARGTTNSVDTEWIALYERSWKVTVNPSRETCTIADVNGSALAPDPEKNPEVASLRTEALRVGRVLRRDPRKHASKEVEERLKSWGYD